jgi:hypothetical protein
LDNNRRRFDVFEEVSDVKNIIRHILIATILFAGVLLTGCASGSAVPVEQPTPTPESSRQLEVEIYRLVVSELYPEGEKFFVFDETDSYISSSLDELKKE